MNQRLFAIALLAFASAGSAQAQKLAPGLWENSMTTKTQSGKAEAASARVQAEMASMPAARRKMMEEMMARQGLSMGAGAGGSPTMVLRACISPEQAARNEIPQGNGNCKQDSLERNGRTLRFKFSCTGTPPSQGSGEITLISDKEHRGHMVVETLRDGKPERIEMEQAGHWLSADCGAIKPRK